MIILYVISIMVKKWITMDKIREFLELQAFGVCSSIGEKLGIASTRIRMWFIYISFLTMGSPIILYRTLIAVNPNWSLTERLR